MASVRVGLKQVSNSNNSPSIKVLQAKKSHATSNFSPLKDKTDAHRKQTPGVVHEGKENQAVQVTVPVRASSAQTVVTTSSPAPVITKEDLLSEEPTSSYWRGMAEKFEKEIDAELENSFNKSLELDKSYEELSESRNRLKILMEVMEDVLDEVKDDEKEKEEEETA
ncbi:hypothetical protein Q1695_014814 [Nippostrongylus brasiliensis]|nr:hypothetical protein Q1695_014814 [Nippostrongylus brasiliensis]